MQIRGIYKEQTQRPQIRHPCVTYSTHFYIVYADLLRCVSNMIFTQGLVQSYINGGFMRSDKTNIVLLSASENHAPRVLVMRNFTEFCVSFSFLLFFLFVEQHYTDLGPLGLLRLYAATCCFLELGNLYYYT